jgi:DNA-binding MarR family transcriptional regulator
MTTTDAVGTRSWDAVDEIIGQWGRVRPDLDVSAMQVFGRLHRSFLLYRSAIAERFTDIGTTEPGFDVLAALRRSGAEQRLTAGELARQTLVTTGGLTLRVKRLEKDGLVRRERDPEDHRMVYVSLTDAGRDLVDRTADRHFPTMARMLEGLTGEERDELARLLGRLFDCLQEASPGVDLTEAAAQA